jgi:hypothetical protein
MTDDLSPLEAQVVASLRLAARPVPTAEVIAAAPGWPGWQVRRTLDALAAAGVVRWRRGKNNPTARVWRLAPARLHRRA